jgi:hypothetical protein
MCGAGAMHKPKPITLPLLLLMLRFVLRTAF